MKNKTDLNAILSLLLIISLVFIFIFNMFNYDPIYGYDAEAHYEYVEGFFAMYIPGLSEQPSNEITREFFNPPLPYVLPATISLFCKKLVDVEDEAKYCQKYYGKSIQITNLFLFFLSIYFYLLTFKFITKKKLINLNVILPISILAVNYKTFSMIRGEPFIIFFNSVLIFYLARHIKNNFDIRTQDYIVFGMLLGLMGLSRQWAFFVISSLCLSSFCF